MMIFFFPVFQALGEENSSIRRLCLNRTEIGAEDFSALSSALRTNFALQKIECDCYSPESKREYEKMERALCWNRNRPVEAEIVKTTLRNGKRLPPRFLLPTEAPVSATLKQLADSPECKIWA